MDYSPSLVATSRSRTTATVRRFRLFVGLVGGFLGLIVWINMAQPGFDVYGEGRTYLQLLHRIPTAKTDTAVAKMTHAATHERYDVGLFGNSRIWMVGREHIGLDRSVFNFAVPGQSFRQSVLLLKELASFGKVPHTVVISFDHVSLQLPEDPVFPVFPRRWYERAREFLYILNNEEGGLKKGLVFAYNNAFWEYDLLEQALSYQYLWPKAMLLLADVIGLDEAGTGYRDRQGRFLRPDGSRLQPEAVKRDIVVQQEALSAFVLLEHDLRALKTVKDQSGARVIIYESPIHPEVADRVERNLGEIPLGIRATLRAKCAAYGFECHDFPRLVPHENGPYWEDFSHAPSAHLGEWIRRMVLKAPPGGRSE